MGMEVLSPYMSRPTSLRARGSRQFLRKQTGLSESAVFRLTFNGYLSMKTALETIISQKVFMGSFHAGGSALRGSIRVRYTSVQGV